MDWEIYGISAVVVITLIVQLIKTLGLDPRWAVLAAIVVGVVLSAANYLAQIVPGFGNWFQVVMAGLIAGLAAAGLYSGQKALRGQ
jgi:hypothetical protein